MHTHFTAYNHTWLGLPGTRTNLRCVRARLCKVCCKGCFRPIKSCKLVIEFVNQQGESVSKVKVQSWLLSLGSSHTFQEPSTNQWSVGMECFNTRNWISCFTILFRVCISQHLKCNFYTLTLTSTQCSWLFRLPLAYDFLGSIFLEQGQTAETIIHISHSAVSKWT